MNSVVFDGCTIGFFENFQGFKSSIGESFWAVEKCISN